MQKQYEIIDYNGFGAGVSRCNQRVTFVEKSVIGDVVTLKDEIPQKRFTKALVDEIVVPSAHRQKPFCPHFEQCGGCQIPSVDDKHYKTAKQRIFKSKVRKGLKLYSETEVHCFERFGYRNKAVFEVNDEGRLCYYSLDFTLIPIKTCPILEKSIFDCIDFLNALLAGIEQKDRPKKVILKSFPESKPMLGLVFVKKPLDKRLKDIIQSAEEKFGCIYSAGFTNSKGKIGKIDIITGADTFEMVLGNQYLYYPGAFFQTNRNVMEKMYQRIIQWVEDSQSESCLDLYCGMGTILCSMSSKIIAGHGIESCEQAIESAKLASKKMKNISFEQSKLPNASIDFSDYSELWVVNPPRAGLGGRFFKETSRNFPLNLVYMSCNPITLEKDLDCFCDAGYEICEVETYDMFPWTAHFETLVRLQK